MNVLRHHHRLVAVSTACAALVTAIGLVLTGTAGRTHATERALQLPSKQIAFLQEKQTPDIKETVAQAVERMRVGAANAERMAGELGEALGRIAQPAR